MAKRKVFVSFDYENDRKFKYLLEAWDANDDFEFCFNDMSSDEIKTSSISVVKQKLSQKINAATYTLVLVGKEANQEHKDAREIGYRNWINYEIAKSKEYGNKLVAVKLEKNCTSPDELLGSGTSWAYSFSQEAIINALKNAANR